MTDQAVDVGGPGRTGSTGKSGGSTDAPAGAAAVNESDRPSGKRRGRSRTAVAKAPKGGSKTKGAARVTLPESPEDAIGDTPAPVTEGEPPAVKRRRLPLLRRRTAAAAAVSPSRNDDDAAAVSDAAASEPAVSEPAPSEAAVREPAVREPAVSETAVSEPAPSEAAVREPAVREPAVREPAVREPAARAAAVSERAVGGKPVSDPSAAPDSVSVVTAAEETGLPAGPPVPAEAVGPSVPAGAGVSRTGAGSGTDRAATEPPGALAGAAATEGAGGPGEAGGSAEAEAAATGHGTRETVITPGSTAAVGGSASGSTEAELDEDMAALYDEVGPDDDEEAPVARGVTRPAGGGPTGPGGGPGRGTAGLHGIASQPSPGAARGGATAPAFFGRLRELKALRGDIERAGLNTLSGRKEPRARVLLIAGRPGSGRTALAEELAGQLRDGYPDGIVRVRLTEPGGEPVPTERAARAILGAFGITTPPGAGEDELSEMVREALAVRRVLLFLDEAADAEQVDPLVPDNPDCLVIAVAQGPLTGIPDVRPCTLGGMDAKAAIELLTRFTGAVRITVDPQAAESLAEECGGQPAALVLIGGWLAARPTASVADATKRLRALPHDPERPVGDRPLARAFRLVYETLPPSVARSLRLLSLAPAGLVDAHTASALAGCSVSAARTALRDFTALGLLRGPVGPAADDRTGDDQYLVPGCLLPLLRDLREKHDREAEVQLARARMLERTVRLLQSCRAITEPDGSPARKRLAGLPRSLRYPNTAAAAGWLDSREPALLASARLAVADGELDTLARRLIAALVRALAAHRGTEAAAPELYGLHQLVLDIAERRELHREQAAALLNIGDLDARTGRTQDALARYRAALDAGRAANDLYATGRAMESVGGAYQDLQDWQRAADWYGRALAQRLSRGERADEARLYGRLGTVHTYAGHYGEALRSWRAAVAGYRRLRDLPGQARALSEAARVQEYAGRPQESLETCQEAVEWARLAGDVRLQAALQLRVADTLDRLGDPTAARLHRATADRLLETEGNTYEIRSTSAGE